VLWAALFAAFLLLVPAFQGMFDDFGVEVPGLTLLMIKISYGLSRFWHIVVPLGMVGMAFDFAILFLLGKVGRRVQSLAGLLLLLVPLALGGLLLLSLGLPMARLIEALS
jgi:type II secretory pathway component PulF